MSMREQVQKLSQEYTDRGDALGWFEALYAQAAGNSHAIPWADLAVNPHLQTWRDRTALSGTGKTALVIGCGLGDDAEYLDSIGFRVTAFDLSPTAIAWCQARFPDSSVQYHIADLFNAPFTWTQHFDFVLEIYTVQALPPHLQAAAMTAIAAFVAPHGQLLAMSRGREQTDGLSGPPFPLLRSQFSAYEHAGLILESWADFSDLETPPVRRFQAVYRAAALPL